MSHRKSGFADLIEALAIMDKYIGPDDRAGTHCEHDVLMICGVEPSEVSEEDKKRLTELGFHDAGDYGDEGFQSFRWGRC